MKKSSKILVIVLIIIVTFSLGTLGGYYLFKIKSDSNNNSSVNNGNKDTENTSKEESLSLNDTTVKELYSRKTNFHTSSKVNYDNLSDQKKLSVLLDGLQKKRFKLGYKDICAKLKTSGNQNMLNNYNTCLSMENKWEDDTDLVTYYSVEDVRKNNIKYFNESTNLPKEYNYVMTTTLEVAPECENVVLQSNDNYYLDLDMHCGYGGLDPIIEKELVKATKKDEEIVLYDTYILGTGGNDTEDGQYFNFYQDEDMGTKVKTIKVNITDNGVSYDKTATSGSKKTYKHTYKKNNSGEYYWVSSEPVSNID